MGREHAFRASLLVALVTTGLWASTSWVHAIDPDASAARRIAAQQAAAEENTMRERVTQMESQIAQMDKELDALRAHQIQLQQELQTAKSANGTASHAPMTTK